MKFELMLRILFELLSKKIVTASYLADKLEVSVRSIHRYINALELAGVPIYTERGVNGGFKIIDTYRLNSTFMTKVEFDKTINALEAITSSVPDKNLSVVIDKLKATIRHEYSGFDVKGGNLIIDAGPWGDATSYKTKLKIIQQSIEENNILEIKYHDRNGEITIRKIEPHVIVFKQGLWYVFSYCHLRNDFRFFKTGRIEYINVTDEKFKRRDISNMDLPLDFWHNSIETIDVSFEIDKNYLSDIEEWIGIENITCKDGKYIAEAKLPDDNGLVTKLMSFGNGLKIIYPKELKEKVKAIANDIVKTYS